MARGSRLARVGALGLLAVLTLGGCSVPDNTFWRFGWPNGVTDQAKDMRELWTSSCIAALVIGFLVWGLIIWSMIRYRKRNDQLPRQTAYNLPLEIVYTIVPFVIIAVLFFFTVRVQDKVISLKAKPDVTVAVNAFKWNWQFVYPSTTGPDGQPVNTLGTSTEIPILVLPTDRVVRITVDSADVIHSFWVPEFLFKRDVIPGNSVEARTFQLTIRKTGAYVGHCAELCGTYHAFMNFEVRAVTPDQFQRYLNDRAKGMSTAKALVDVGSKPGTAVTTHPFNLSKQEQLSNG